MPACVSWRGVASLPVFCFLRAWRGLDLPVKLTGSQRAVCRRGRRWKLAYHVSACVYLITWSWVQIGMTHKCLSLREKHAIPTASLVSAVYDYNKHRITWKRIVIPSLISNSRDLPLVPEPRLWTSDSLHLSLRFTLWMYYSRVKLNQPLLVISHVFRLYLNVWPHMDKCTERVTNTERLIRKLIVIAMSLETLILSM